MSERILVVDDEVNIVRSIELILSGEGFEVIGAGSEAEAIGRVGAEPFDAAILDVQLHRRDDPEDPGGLKVLRHIRAERPSVPVVMVSGHATIDQAVRATKLGALDFMEKPFTRDRVLLAVRNMLEMRRLSTENLRLRGDPLAKLLGESAAIARLREDVGRVGATEARVLIQGDSGTGKELVARALHDLSPRADGPFVKLNCAAIAQDLIEAELFGAVKGAYTGAVADRVGRFAAADGGTLLLDEIGDMSLEAQAKVLRVLQEGEFEPVGSTRTQSVDVRVIAATHKDLREGAREGWFREDLYFRLAVVPIAVPSLRERPDDVPRLLEHFLARFADQHGVSAPTVHAAAAKLLTAHAWRGNVRELMNLAERLVILRHGLEVTREDLPAEVLEPGRPAGVAATGSGGGPPAAAYAHLPLREAREALERDLVRDALARHRGNVTRAARDLGLERTNLHKRIRALGLRDEDGEATS
jgi:two-component system nitrogen regulation response regulator NtrX